MKYERKTILLAFSAIALIVFLSFTLLPSKKLSTFEFGDTTITVEASVFYYQEEGGNRYVVTVTVTGFPLFILHSYQDNDLIIYCEEASLYASGLDSNGIENIVFVQEITSVDKPEMIMEPDFVVEFTGHMPPSVKFDTSFRVRLLNPGEIFQTEFVPAEFIEITTSMTTETTTETTISESTGTEKKTSGFGWVLVSAVPLVIFVYRRVKRKKEVVE